MIRSKFSIKAALLAPVLGCRRLALLDRNRLLRSPTPTGTPARRDTYTIPLTAVPCRATLMSPTTTAITDISRTVPMDPTMAGTANSNMASPMAWLAAFMEEAAGIAKAGGKRERAGEIRPSARAIGDVAGNRPAPAHSHRAAQDGLHCNIPLDKPVGTRAQGAGRHGVGPRMAAAGIFR
jgi:hypothetical protein